MIDEEIKALVDDFIKNGTGEVIDNNPTEWSITPKIKSLIGRVLDECTPEKREVDIWNADATLDINTGFNQAIDQIKANREKWGI